MFATKTATILMMLCLISLTCSALCTPVPARTVGETQLQALAPDEQALQGFVRTNPPAKIPGLDPTYLAKIYTGYPEPDEVELNKRVTEWSVAWTPLFQQSGAYSLIQRNLFSENGHYTISIIVMICDSVSTAQSELSARIQQSQLPFHLGTYSGRPQIGDESWINTDSTWHALLCRYGKTIVFVQGQPSFAASKLGYDQPFPPIANEAVAYQILLSASQQPELTGISMQQANVAVNGHALPKGALLVAGQTYVPVKEFAKAMGMTSQWDTKTGALILSGKGRKTVALTAGSTATKNGTVTGPTLRVPVLKNAGQPVMTLADLLTVTGAKITQQTTGSVQVKG